MRTKKTLKRQRKGAEGTGTGTGKVIVEFMEILNTIKLYHWNTTNYGHHIASNELYEKLSALIDHYIEMMIGDSSPHIRSMPPSMEVILPKTKKELIKRLMRHIHFLNDLEKDANRALRTVQDEMLECIQQFIYLASMD
jgi:hypothetical protein